MSKSAKSRSSRPPRRPQTGGYARGDETRRKIIFAGIKLFGERGFDGASTRDIAAEAGVNAPALQYYFANKEGLFKACAEYLSDAAWTAFEPAILQASAVLRKGAPVPVLIEAFRRILEAIADQLFGKEALPGQSKFAARLQAGLDPVNGGAAITQRIRQPLSEVATELMSRITGVPADAPITALRLLSLIGQNQIFRIADYAAFPSLGWKGFDAEKAALIKATIREQAIVLLEHWSKLRTPRPRASREEVAFPAPGRRPSR